MSPKECLRLQGIGPRNFNKVSASRIREMAGNSMNVSTVSALVRSVFSVMKMFQGQIGFENAAPAPLSQDDPELTSKPLWFAKAIKVNVPRKVRVDNHYFPLTGEL